MAGRGSGALRASKRSVEPTVSRMELLADGTGLAFRQLVHDMLAFGSSLQEIRNRLAATIGLSGTQYTILTTIAHLREQEDVGINRVAEHLHLSGAFVTIEVNKLVDAELVKKKVNPEDRRRVVLTLAAKGNELLSQLRTVQRPVNDTLFDKVTPSEFDVLSRIMGTLVGNAGRALRLIDYLAEDRRRIG